MAQDVPPKVLHRVEPIYANGAIEQHHEGTVVLGFTVGLDGKAKDVGTLRTVGWGLDEQSMEALKFWRFAPATRDGEPVEARTTAEFIFKLPDFDTAYRPGNGVTPPRVIATAQPEYTEAARVNRIQGTAVLRCVVDTDGVPRTIRVMRGLPNGLNEKAWRALAQWKFAPGTKDGEPVPVQAVIEMNFRLP
jgi:TonB family protein